jgi:hypothetical protein
MTAVGNAQVQVFFEQGNTPFCLDVPNGGDWDGNSLQLWTCDPNNPNQRWNFAVDGRIIWSGHNKYVLIFHLVLIPSSPSRLINCPYRCLDVPNGAPGSTVSPLTFLEKLASKHSYLGANMDMLVVGFR